MLIYFQIALFLYKKSNLHVVSVASISKNESLRVSNRDFFRQVCQRFGLYYPHHFAKYVFEISWIVLPLGTRKSDLESLHCEI